MGLKMSGFLIGEYRHGLQNPLCRRPLEGLLSTVDCDECGMRLALPCLPLRLASELDLDSHLVWGHQVIQHLQSN